MPGPSTETDVANLALDLCKIEPIANFDSVTDTVTVIAKRHRDQSRRVALESHTWNFATKRAVLNQLGGAPAFGYSIWYNLPNDFIRLVGIGAEEVEYDYAIEDGKLLIDELGGGTLPFRYIYDHLTVSRMSPSFIEVWSVYWAMKMAKPLGCSNSLIKELSDLLDGISLGAEAIDGQQTVVKRIERSKYRNARRGYAGRRTDIIE